MRELGLASHFQIGSRHVVSPASTLILKFMAERLTGKFAAGTDSRLNPPLGGCQIGIA